MWGSRTESTNLGAWSGLVLPVLMEHLELKVVNMGTTISETKLMDKWAASKRTQVSAILCIKLLPLLENVLKLNFKVGSTASAKSRNFTHE